MMIVLQILLMIVSVMLIASVLMQSRGTSLGSAFGGAGETYRSKKGIEKVLFYATIVLAALFAALAIFSLVLV